MKAQFVALMVLLTVSLFALGMHAVRARRPVLCRVLLGAAAAVQIYMVWFTLTQPGSFERFAASLIWVLLVAPPSVALIAGMLVARRRVNRSQEAHD